MVQLLHRHGFAEQWTHGWQLTLGGGALAMASFNRPVSRAAAERLLKGVVERARTYDQDDTKPLRMKRLRVFGSYLDENVNTLSDLDLVVELIDRVNGWSSDTNALLEYARQSGREFRSFLDELTWARAEVLLTLRKRSGYIKCE
jgi:hypothetical protein